jgi:hypothetical protein
VRSIVYHFLQDRGMVQSLSVFVPESGLGRAALGKMDILQFLHASLSRNTVCAQMESGQTTILDVILDATCFPPELRESACQTHDAGPPAREMLGEFLVRTSAHV